MNLFDFYKLITTNIISVLLFILILMLLYLLFIVVMTFLVEQLCKIIIVIRAPISNKLINPKD